MPGFSGNIFNWCAADGVTDDSSNLLDALTDAAAAGGTLEIPAEADVYLPTAVQFSGPVRITGGGKITHTRKGGLHIAQPLTALGAIAAAASVAYPTVWNGPATETTKITLATTPPRGVARGRILIITSDDDLLEYAPAKLGELARVQAVDGKDVYLSGKLEFTYTTNPVAHLLSDDEVDISGITFQDPTYLSENTGEAGTALALETCTYARVTARFKDQANAALGLTSCWEPYVDTSVHNGRNNHPDSSYGYGVLIGCSTAFGNVRVIGTNNRHLVSGGASKENRVAAKGAPRHNTVHDSLAISPLSAGFDTHEAVYHTRFVNCWVHKQIGNPDYAESTLYAFVDRGAGTQYIGCGSVGVGGFSLAGAAANRAGSAGRYTTRVLGHTIDSDVFNPSTGLRIWSAYDATVAGYHEVEITGGRMRRTHVNVMDGAPKVTFDGLDLREVDTNWAFRCGVGNNVSLRNLARRCDTGNMSPIEVGPGSTVVVDGYTADASGWTSGTLVYATGGAGTATVKLERVHSTGAALTQIAKSDGTTTLAGGLLGAPLRPVAKGATGSRPTLGDFEKGQQYLDTTLAAAGKPIWWNGTAWVDGTGASV